MAYFSGAMLNFDRVDYNIYNFTYFGVKFHPSEINLFSTIDMGYQYNNSNLQRSARDPPCTPDPEIKVSAAWMSQEVRINGQ